MNYKRVIACLGLIIGGSGLAQWGEPVKLPPQINKYGEAWDARISPDGRQLYFTIMRPLNYGGGIWVARWNGVDWDSVIHLGPNINDSAGGGDWSPSVTADGKKLYWVSWRDGGVGAWDVWYSEWDEFAQDWGPAKNCGSPVNYPGTDGTAFIAPDGKKIFFSSMRYEGMECLWYSEWDGNGWAPPKMIWSTGSDAQYPWVSADGKTLYYSRWYGDYPEIFKCQWGDTAWGEPELVGPPISLSAFYDGSPSLSPDCKKFYFVTTRPDSIGSYVCVSEWLGGVAEKQGKQKGKNSSLQVKPNPFDRKVEIEYEIYTSSSVKLEILDTLGRVIKLLLNSYQSPGKKEIIWDCKDNYSKTVGCGTYYCRLTVDNSNTVQKLIALK